MQKETQKLFRVQLRGLGALRNSYVVAKSPTEAYDKVIDYLNKKDIGFVKDRELSSIELLAEDYEYSDCDTLFL